MNPLQLLAVAGLVASVVILLLQLSGHWLTRGRYGALEWLVAVVMGLSVLGMWLLSGTAYRDAFGLVFAAYTFAVGIYVGKRLEEWQRGRAARRPMS